VHLVVLAEGPKTPSRAKVRSLDPRTPRSHKISACTGGVTASSRRGPWHTAAAPPRSPAQHALTRHRRLGAAFPSSAQPGSEA
jgi:hypothetical protein